MRKCVISSPVATQSGYGHHAREFITNTFKFKSNEWDIKLVSMPWGHTPFTYPLPDRRVECGLDGREFCLNDGLTSKQMADKMVEMMNFLFNNPKEKRPRYTLSKVESVTYKEMGIV